MATVFQVAPNAQFFIRFKGRKGWFRVNVNQEDGESFDSLLRRFTQKVKRDGILSEYKRKRFFVSKSVEKREKMKKSAQRQRRKAQKD